MADEVKLDVEVNGVDSGISSLKDLKNAIKEARNEQIKAQEAFGIGSKQYIEASKRVSELKDKVDDLSDSTKSLKGSGIERASAGFQQLGEGIRNLDFDKLKVGLTAVKSALAATGIMLLVQGVTYLIQNFDELKNSSGFVGQALTKVGEIVGAVKDFFTDLIGATTEESRAVNALSEEIKQFAEATKESLANQTQAYDRLISVASAEGKNTIELEKAKQKEIAFSNYLIAKRYEAIAKQRVLTDEERKAVNEAINNYLNANAAFQTAIIKDEKKTTDEKKKELDKQKEIEKNHLKDLRDLWLDYQNNRVLDQSSYEAQMKAFRDQVAADEKAASDAKIIADSDAEIAKLEKEKAAKELATQKAKEESELERQKFSEMTMYAQSYTDSLKNLSDIYFLYKSRNLQKGSQAELENAKKQFQINKALSIVSATISGIQGVVNALSANSVIPEPYGTILKVANAVAVGIASATNIAKIAATQFNPGTTSSSGSGGASAPPVPAPPTISTPQANVGGTNFDENGKNLTNTNNPTINVKTEVNATVGVDEINKKQNRVEALEKQSSF